MVGNSEIELAAKRDVSAIEFAEAYAQLKRKEETLRYLELAYGQHAPLMAQIS